jgi:hypothetical protein
MTESRVRWVRGGEARIVSVAADEIAVCSTVAHPPGSRVEGEVAALGGRPVRVKVHACRLQPEGDFLIRGRLLDLSRADRLGLERVAGKPPSTSRSNSVDGEEEANDADRDERKRAPPFGQIQGRRAAQEVANVRAGGEERGGAVLRSEDPVEDECERAPASPPAEGRTEEKPARVRCPCESPDVGARDGVSDARRISGAMSQDGDGRGEHGSAQAAGDGSHSDERHGDR